MPGEPPGLAVGNRAVVSSLARHVAVLARISLPGARRQGNERRRRRHAILPSCRTVFRVPVGRTLASRHTAHSRDERGRVQILLLATDIRHLETQVQPKVSCANDGEEGKTDKHWLVERSPRSARRLRSTSQRKANLRLTAVYLSMECLRSL